MDTKTKIRSLIYAANDKTGKGDTDLTTAVQSLISKTGGITPSGNKALTPSETAQTGIDVTNFATVSVDAIPSTYVGSGVTKKAAATVAPSISEQTVCASGVYTTGEQKVSAITPSIVGNLDASSFAASIVAAVEGKGVTVPDGTLLDGMASLIESIEAGGNVRIGNFTTVTYGSFQPAEDAPTYTIDLGYKGGGGAPVVEQFFLSRDMTSTYSGTSTNNSLVIAAHLENVSSSSIAGLVVTVARYYNSSGNISTSTGRICEYNDLTGDNTPRTITISARQANSSCVLTSGATYNWIALRRQK